MTTIAPSRIGCSAVIGQAASDYDFRPVLCRQVVAVHTYEAAAPFLAHLTVGYCARPGHRASVERRYPPLDTPDPDADADAAHRARHGLSPFMDFRTPDYPDITGHEAGNAVPEQGDPMTAAKALRDRDGWPA